MQVTNIANNPKCPTCNSRMACFQDKSWRCPKCAPQAQEETRGAPAPAGDRCPACGFPWTRKPGQACPTADCNYVEPPAPASPAGTRKMALWVSVTPFPGDELRHVTIYDAKGGPAVGPGTVVTEPVAAEIEYRIHYFEPEPAAPEAGAPGTQEGGSQP